MDAYFQRLPGHHGLEQRVRAGPRMALHQHVGKLAQQRGAHPVEGEVVEEFGRGHGGPQVHAHLRAPPLLQPQRNAFVDARELGAIDLLHRATGVGFAAVVQQVHLRVLHEVADPGRACTLPCSSRVRSACSAVERLTPWRCISSRTDGMRAPGSSTPWATACW